MHKTPKKFWQVGAAPIVPLIVGAVILISAVVAVINSSQLRKQTITAQTSTCTGGVQLGACCSNGRKCASYSGILECSGDPCTPVFTCIPRGSDCTGGGTCCTGLTCDAQSGTCEPAGVAPPPQSTCSDGTPVGSCCSSPGKLCGYLTGGGIGCFDSWQCQSIPPPPSPCTSAGAPCVGRTLPCCTGYHCDTSQDKCIADSQPPPPGGSTTCAYHCSGTICVAGGTDPPDTCDNTCSACGGKTTVAFPSAPVGLTASCPAPGTSVSVRWDVVRNAAAYALRADDLTNGWTGTCSSVNPGDFCNDAVGAESLTFATTPGHSYRWWVHAVRGTFGAAAQGTNFTCAGTAPPTTPLIPNCKDITGPTTVNLGGTYTYSASYENGAGPLTTRGLAITSNNCVTTNFWQSSQGGAATLSWSWTPPAAGTYEVDCRAWNDAIAECRGNCVDGPPRYSCPGPGAKLTVNVVTTSITPTPTPPGPSFTPTTTPTPTTTQPATYACVAGVCVAGAGGLSLDQCQLSCGAPTQTPTPTTTGCPAISPPALTSMDPVNDFEAGLRDVRWDAVSGASFYALRIDDKQDDWPPTRAGATNTCADLAAAQAAGTNLKDVCINNLTTTTYSYEFLVDHTYDWWVHAINNCGQYSSRMGPMNIRALPPPPTITPGGPSLTPTPISPPVDTPTIPPEERCALGNETYQKGQSYCDELNNSVKTCTGNDIWQDVQDACPGLACSNDPTFFTYSCVAKCEALVDNPGRKLKIAFLPENYTSYNEFKLATLDAIDQIKKTNLGPLINKMNFYFVYDFNQSYHVDPSKPYEGVQFEKIHETGSSVCGADSSIVIGNPTTCGSTPGGVSMLGLSSYACGSGDNVVPHELSKAIVWLDDEYGDAGSPPGLQTLAPNCSDSPSCLNWKGMPGTGCFQGCGHGTGNGFSNWYRPTETSIMRELGNYTFNLPSLRAWRIFLNNYK